MQRYHRLTASLASESSNQTMLDLEACQAELDESMDGISIGALNPSSRKWLYNRIQMLQIFRWL